MNSPKLSVFILASHRSGSSFLCDLLRNTQVCGNPTEYFMHYQGVSYQNWDLSDYNGYLKRIINETQTPNHVFSVKLMTGMDGIYGMVKRLFPKWKGDYRDKFPAVCQLFPHLKCIYLTRRNKIAQAVSWYKAGKTDRYHSTRNIDYSDNIEYNFHEIQDLVTSLVMEESAHQEFFDVMNITPFTIVYEDFIKDISNSLKNIFKFLHITDSYSIKTSKHTKMADYLSLKWIQRYRREAQAHQPLIYRRW